LERLASRGASEKHSRDHLLCGQQAGVRDCRVEPDWAPIRSIIEEELRLLRTGTHADLFKR
jgi:mRNA interferase YafQ